MKSSNSIEDSNDGLEKSRCLRVIWDYMLMGHDLKNVDAIIVLGSWDTNVGVYAAELFKRGLAPWLVCAGSGSANHGNPAYRDFVGSTEAEVFRSIAVANGVPADNIIVEDRSQVPCMTPTLTLALILTRTRTLTPILSGQNTGQNYEFTIQLLEEKNIQVCSAIMVQKQFMERRTYATGKVWWPDVDLVVTSPPTKLEDYPTSNPAIVAAGEHWIHAMVGDLQRIREYPARGFQIKQDVPVEVWECWKALVAMGYTDCLLKDVTY